MIDDDRPAVLTGILNGITCTMDLLLLEEPLADQAEAERLQ